METTSSLWKNKMKNSHINLCLDFIDLNTKKYICKTLKNKKLYSVYQFNINSNIYRKKIYPHTENSFPYNIIGRIYVLKDYNLIHTQTAFAIDEKFVITAIEYLRDYLININKLNNQYSIIFVLREKEYIIKDWLTIFDLSSDNYTTFIQSDYRTDMINENSDMYYYLAYKAFKSNLVILELNDGIDELSNKEDYFKILEGFLGFNHKYLNDQKIYKIKLYSYIEKKDLHPVDYKELLQVYDDSLFNKSDKIYVEFNSVAKYLACNDFISFDIPGINNSFLGSPIFIENPNGEQFLSSILTGKCRKDSIDSKFYQNTIISRKYLNKPYIAEIFINTKILKDFNIIQKDSLSDLRIKNALEIFRDLDKKATLNVAWSNLKNEGVYTITNSLKYIKKLIYLDFRGCKIGPLGAINLAKNLIYLGSTLKNLNISFNKIGPKAIRCVAFSLRFLNNLTIFDVSSNLIEDEGAGYLSKYLGFLKMLSYLDISNNEFTETGVTLIKNNKPDSKFNLEIRF